MAETHLSLISGPSPKGIARVTPSCFLTSSHGSESCSCFWMTTLVCLYSYPGSNMAASPAGTLQASFSLHTAWYVWARRCGDGKALVYFPVSPVLFPHSLGWCSQQPQRSGSLEGAEYLFPGEFTQIHSQGRCLLPSLVVWEPLYCLNQASFVHMSSLNASHPVLWRSGYPARTPWIQPTWPESPILTWLGGSCLQNCCSFTVISSHNCVHPALSPISPPPLSHIDGIISLAIRVLIEFSQVT